MKDKQFNLKIENKGKRIWNEIWQDFKDNEKDCDVIEFIKIVNKKFEKDIADVKKRIKIKKSNLKEFTCAEVKDEVTFLKILKVCLDESNKQLKKESKSKKN